jgi:hypothetical protein
MKVWMKFISLENIPLAGFCEHTVGEFPFTMFLASDVFEH